MNFTFGIITDGTVDSRINTMIDSIERESIPTYEIIIVGNSAIKRKNTVIIPFDDSIKYCWVTKKKNIITEKAQYENIVYMNDYVVLEPEWYNGFLKFGNDFSLCMNKILKIDGSRFLDWTLHQYDARLVGIPRWRFMLPYDEVELSKFMYFSGTYWVGKKKVMQVIPFDESVVRGQGEDVIWSMQIRNFYDFSMNAFSSVRLLKDKETAYDNSRATPEDIFKLKEGLKLGTIKPVVNTGDEIKDKIRRGII